MEPWGRFFWSAFLLEGHCHGNFQLEGHVADLSNWNSFGKPVETLLGELYPLGLAAPIHEIHSLAARALQAGASKLEP